MKKNKVIGLIALSMMLGLSGCNLLISQQCDHDWEPWEIVEDPTCIERGYKERSCLNCGKQQSRSIRIDTINGHRWVDDEDANREATCTEPGVVDSKICYYCHMKQAGTKTQLSGHKLQVAADQSDPKYTSATCTTDGLVAMECRVCHEIVDQKVNALGHQFSTNVDTESVPGVGIVKCANNCGKIMAYELDITKATGWNRSDTNMNVKTGETSMSNWDISGLIPEGSYDVQLEAAMTSDSHKTRKLYNMARADLAVGSDTSNNGTGTNADKATEDPYRYLIRVDGLDFNPSTKESYEELGLQARPNTSSAIPYTYIDFVEGIEIGASTSKISLVHGNIGYSLYCKSIRLIPHEHHITSKNVEESGKVRYQYDTCDECGYKGIKINATAGTVSGSTDSAAPSGYVSLGAQNSSLAYKFAVEEDLTGNVYMLAKVKRADADQSPYTNIKWEANGTVINLPESNKTFADLLGFESETDEYTKEGYIYVGKTTLKAGSDQQLKYTRVGNYNIYVKEVLFKAKPAGHFHNFVVTSTDAANCTKNEIKYYACSCGQEYFEETPNSKVDHTWVEDPAKEQIPPTCTEPGMGFYVCSVCKNTKRETLPPTHDMQDVTPENFNDYTIKECSNHDAMEYSWSIEQAVPGVREKSGYFTGQSSKSVSASVYKLPAEESITLTFNVTGEHAGATLKVYATTKTSNIGNCQMYTQTIGEESKGGAKDKYTVTVNDTPVVFPASVKDKTLEELGAKAVNSTMVDSQSNLADPVWFDYCTVDLQDGVNTIVITKPNAAGYSAYFGGFAVSF